MFRSAYTGGAFLLLMVFLTNNCVESHPGLVKKSSLLYKNDATDFLKCVSRNIDNLPIFSQKEKEYILVTVETLILSTVSSEEAEDSALSTDEIFTPKTDVNFLVTSSKRDTLAKSFESCCETSPDCANKAVIVKMQDFARQYTMDSFHSSSASEISNSPSSMPESSLNSELNHNSVSVDKPKIKSVRQIKESITITDEDIRTCASAVNANSNIFALCHKIFNRGVWDEKADRTLDGDIKKLITLMYGGKRENIGKVLNFIDEYVPRNVRELTVSYSAIVKVFTRNDDFQRIKIALNRIKKMNGHHYSEKYFYAKQIHKNMLENILMNLQVIENGESISITDEDIRDCVHLVQRNWFDEAKVLGFCDKIFRRGMWDDKADRTLDGDIRKLISLIYEGKPENIPRVLYFIEKYVPKIVRELVVSYDSAVNEFMRNRDFTLIVNQPYILKIRNSVKEIKNMNGDHISQKYKDAHSNYKNMIENILTILKVPEGKRVTLTGDDVQDCAESAKLILGNHSEVLRRCNKVFDRNSLDNKTERTLDYDIRRLISLIYNGRSENTARVLYFVEKYVPRSVLERIVSYDAIILEFEKREDDLNSPKNQLYLDVIRSAVIDIKKMNGSDPSANYEKAGRVDKDIMDKIYAKLWVTQNESITITNEDIRECAKTVKLNFEDDYEVLVSCAHIFNRGVWDAKADQTIDGDIRKLIILIYDGKRENTEKVLRFIDKYVPYFPRERIVSYNTFIAEFQEHGIFNLLRKQLYLQQLRYLL